MNRPVTLRPDADADVVSIFAEYEEIRKGLGRKFLARLRELLEQIEFTPEAFGSVLDDIRAARLKKFRHVVYYVVFPDRVEVIAVLQGARDSHEWRHRI
jgi:toxin ParE1/3/4